MALVSSITTTTIPSIHARTNSDAPPLVRALPSPPAVHSPASRSQLQQHYPSMSSASTTKGMNVHAGTSSQSRTGGNSSGFVVTSSRTGGGQGGYGQPPSPHQSRQGPSLYPTTSQGTNGGSGSSPSSSSTSTNARTPSPLPPPARSASTPPTASFYGSSSSSPSGSPQRPSAVPLPGQGSSGSFRQHHHSASSSSSSLPRISPSGQQQPYQPQSTNYMQQPQLAHPSFVGQPFAPFAPPHAFAHPAFPFAAPSPHPGQNNSNANNYVSYQSNGQATTPGGSSSTEQQKRMQQAFLQQAQWQQAANQMEMLKLQQQQQQQQQQADWQNGRRRTASGPAANHSPTYYTNPLPYPPSPSPSLGLNGGKLPAGAMLPHFAANHGYPTPPGSVEGVQRGGESGGSSSGGSREGGYHPYRRDHHASSSAGGGGGVKGSSSSERSASASRHVATPSTSSVASRTQPQSQPQQYRPGLHGRTESSHSQHQQQPFPSSQSTIPRSHTASPSITSTRSATLSTSSSSPQFPPSPAYARSRTQSANSSSSSLHRQHHPQSSSQSSLEVPQPRSNSFDSNRSTTPVQGTNRPRPSPLGGSHQPLPVDSDEEQSDDDDGVESDGTAEATATIGKPSVATANGNVTRSLTVNSLATITNVAPLKEKEKEKKGMKSRFKKAFGGGSSSSSSGVASTTLTEAELEGRGAKISNGGFRPSMDSVSSSETSTQPRTPPSHSSNHRHASQPSVASMASSSTRTINGDDNESTRKPPSSRFRLLNGKFNSSSDNLSISSTVSSASVMIRKLGQMGKLARRNSLMGLTKAFKKDKSSKDSEDGVLAGTMNTTTKDNKKKSGQSMASVSHATVEAESSPSHHHPGMSPAAALAKRQQMHYAEQEANEARQRAAVAAEQEAARIAHARSESMASDAVSVKSGKSGKWGMGKSKTTDDVTEGRAKALEKEKEKLKSRSATKGSRFRLGFGGSKTDLHAVETGSINDDNNSLAGTERGGGSALGLYEDHDTTPRQSLEILAPPQGYSTYGRERERTDSSSEYEPSLYRNGATPPVHKPKAVKGILKGAGTYSQDQFARPRPGFHRNRASSFDAPQQQARPGSPGGAALVNVIPSQAQVDGVGPSTTSPRTDTRLPSSTEQIHDSAVSRVADSTTSNPSAMYGNPSMNASAPVLTQFTSTTNQTSSTTTVRTATGRRIVFAANLSVHTTWPAAIYDRRAEPATCNRLTPTLAQQIKEELNSFKMEEMDVHPDSRKLTHFFV